MVKRSYLITLLLIPVFVLSGCKYNTPEGYSEKHHPYEELVEYAKSIDPDATVTDAPETVEEEYREFMIYPAVIKGVKCSVASASRSIYDSTWGEFAKRYYRMDTDYDYYFIRDMVSKYPVLGVIGEESVSNRFQVNDIVYTEINKDTITEQELDAIYEEYVKCKKELEGYDLRKKYWCEIVTGGHRYRFKTTVLEDKQKEIDRMRSNGDL
jgi:predicted small secreted protein